MMVGCTVLYGAIESEDSRQGLGSLSMLRLGSVLGVAAIGLAEEGFGVVEDKDGDRCWRFDFLDRLSCCLGFLLAVLRRRLLLCFPFFFLCFADLSAGRG